MYNLRVMYWNETIKQLHQTITAHLFHLSHTTGLFLYPLITSENERFFVALRGV